MSVVYFFQTMGTATRLTEEAAGKLEEGIKIIVSRWTALQMAVHNQWGGPHSAHIPHNLSSNLFSLLAHSKDKVYIDEVEDMLDEFMLSLNTQIGDGSIEEIAEKLMIMHEECLEGNYNSILSLKEADPPRRVPTYIQQDDSDDDNTTDEIMSNDDLSAMVVEAPATGSRHSQLNVIDSPPADDGWTVVGGSKRNRGRRN
ncbi:hypothetical protein LIER_19123 [Lithospermum erythrorhizon]|uniref:Pre-rRNA-processing protein TSR2 homolog n=1 Tax=Lithospermum erythrorhizon TaxID=34254 RepID=A0AAV3QIU9_LITER